VHGLWVAALHWFRAALPPVLSAFQRTEDEVSIHRWAAKRDANEDEIVDALRKAGCQVECRRDYDLHVIRAAKHYKLEVKMPKGHLTPRQKKMLASGEDIILVHSPLEALKAVGLA
jgi:hypothetical protein